MHLAVRFYAACRSMGLRHVLDKLVYRLQAARTCLTVNLPKDKDGVEKLWVGKFLPGLSSYPKFSYQKIDH